MIGQDKLEAARRYASLGLPVFPCKPQSKKPATRHGCHDATTDPEQIREWWRRRSDYEVAIATGESAGFFAVDIDPRHGGDATMQALIAEHDSLPTTVSSSTGGGGEHLFFRHPGGYVSSRANALGNGIDVRGEGGYVIAPPSIHSNGKRYQWVIAPGDAAFAEAPDWLKALSVKTAHPTDCFGSGDLGDCDSAHLGTCDSTTLCQSLKEAIAKTVPSKTGQRNLAVFNFARMLKSMPSYAASDKSQLREAVMAWHKAAEPMASGEHSFMDTWAEFVYAWDRVKFAAGKGPLDFLLQEADGRSCPTCPDWYDPTARRLVGLCAVMQAKAGDKPFYLSCRAAAELFGIDRTKANKLLNLLCVEGVLRLVRKGTPGRASEYFYSGV